MLLSRGNEAFYWRSVSRRIPYPLGAKEPVAEGRLGAADHCTRRRPVLGVGWPMPDLLDGTCMIAQRMAQTLVAFSRRSRTMSGV